MEIIEADELALEAMRAGLLNFSAYAESIHKQIEKATLKRVQKGTIVVALSRIAKSSSVNAAPLKPNVQLTDLSIRSSLCAITFEKTADMQRKVAVLHPFQITHHELFTIAENPTEITLVVAEKAKEKITKQFDAKPKAIIDNLVAITVQLPEKLSSTPNIHFVLLSALAAKRITIIELLSTYTETTFVVKKEYMEKAIRALNMYFRK
ncbi:ACT domain-containing protein [Candidatus Giovannonibacteria bacterium]|nr:ACT domain-containing protein [Candidatus Giovannonibacteria bacterium]